MCKELVREQAHESVITHNSLLYNCYVNFANAWLARLAKQSVRNMEGP